VVATSLVEIAVFSLVAAALAAAILIYVHCFRYLIQYSWENDVLRIKLFGVLTVRKFSISDIDGATLVDWKQMIPFTNSFNPRLLFSERWGGYRIGRGIAIRKKAGMIRTVIISPKEPEKLVELINEAKARDR
jgi:hypothetical protein